MEPTVVLLPSPLLGEAAWEPAAAELALRGFSVHVVAARPVPPRTPDDVVDHFVSSVPSDRGVVLVPHSNAGLYVPAVVGRRRVVGAVFVDAGLPPTSGDVPLAPPELFAELATMVDGDGLLPPWTSWWAEDDVAGLFTDPDVRARVEREQPTLPLTYFANRLTIPSGWDTGLAAAYLAFGDTYAEERNLAASRGWPTATMSGSHLHMLTDPGGVAREIGGLLTTTGFAPADVDQ